MAFESFEELLSGVQLENIVIIRTKNAISFSMDNYTSVDYDPILRQIRLNKPNIGFLNKFGVGEVFHVDSIESIVIDYVGIGEVGYVDYIAPEDRIYSGRISQSITSAASNFKLEVPILAQVQSTTEDVFNSATASSVINHVAEFAVDTANSTADISLYKILPFVGNIVAQTSSSQSAFNFNLNAVYRGTMSSTTDDSLSDYDTQFIANDAIYSGTMSSTTDESLFDLVPEEPEISQSYNFEDSNSNSSLFVRNTSKTTLTAEGIKLITPGTNYGFYIWMSKVRTAISIGYTTGEVFRVIVDIAEISANSEFLLKTQDFISVKSGDPTTTGKLVYDVSHEDVNGSYYLQFGSTDNSGIIVIKSITLQNITDYSENTDAGKVSPPYKGTLTVDTDDSTSNMSMTNFLHANGTLVSVTDGATSYGTTVRTESTFSETAYVMTGVGDNSDSYRWEVTPFALTSDFKISMEFAVSSKANFMLFGGAYNEDLYCRLDTVTGGIRLWMDTEDANASINITPIETNLFDGKMHSLEIERRGTKLYAWVGNEFVGEYTAPTYTGTNDIYVGDNNLAASNGSEFEGLIKSFTIEDDGVVIADLETGLNLTFNQPSFPVPSETFNRLSDEVLWKSDSSSLSYEYYEGEENPYLNIVTIGASILDQSFFDEPEAETTFLSNGMITTVHNRAVSGSTSTDLVSSLPTVLSEFEGQEINTIFILHTGGNDISQGSGYPSGDTVLEANYISIVNSITNAGFTVAPTSISYRIPPASNPSAPYNDNIIIPQIASLLPDWLDENGTPYIDLYQATYDNQDTWYEADGIHPDDDGQDAIVAYIASRIQAKFLKDEPNLLVPYDTNHAMDVLVNFGNEVFMKGDGNNISTNGDYTSLGTFRNTDFSKASNFGFTVSGINGVADGRTLGYNELSIENSVIRSSSVWNDASTDFSMLFDVDSFDPKYLYNVRVTSTRFSADTDRVGDVTVGGITQSIDGAALPIQSIEFINVKPEDLVSSGIAVTVASGSSYWYVAGVQIERSDTRFFDGNLVSVLEDATSSVNARADNLHTGSMSNDLEDVDSAISMTTPVNITAPNANYITVDVTADPMLGSSIDSFNLDTLNSNPRSANTTYIFDDDPNNSGISNSDFTIDFSNIQGSFRVNWSTSYYEHYVEYLFNYTVTTTEGAQSVSASNTLKVRFQEMADVGMGEF